MHIIEGPLSGPVIVRRNSRLTGALTGDITVPRGVRLELEGVVTGNLLACLGAKVVIRGRLLGRLYNEHASVTVHGEVGSVHDEDGCRTYLAPTALVRRAPLIRRAG